MHLLPLVRICGLPAGLFIPLGLNGRMRRALKAGQLPRRSPRGSSTQTPQRNPLKDPLGDPVGDRREALWVGRQVVILIPLGTNLSDNGGDLGFCSIQPQGARPH